MRVVELVEQGYPGLFIREDGVLISEKGKEYKPYVTGQIRIPKGRYADTGYQSMGKLVATIFIPNPKGYKHVDYRNGKRTDCSVSNVFWCAVKPRKRNGYQAEQDRAFAVISRHVRGKSNGVIMEETGLSEGFVQEIVDKFQGAVNGNNA